VREKEYILYFKGINEYGHEHTIKLVALGLKELDEYTANFNDFKELYYSLDDLLDEQPDIVSYLGDGSQTIFLEIDIDTGEVTNWPKNCPTDFHDIKIVDTGNYWLVDDNAETVISYSGYVPSCLGAGGYGDYLEFEIDGNSHIVDWSFDQEDYDEFEENA
jgi:hypothetical protein